jgi:hypothetical protein
MGNIFTSPEVRKSFQKEMHKFDDQVAYKKVVDNALIHSALKPEVIHVYALAMANKSIKIEDINAALINNDNFTIFKALTKLNNKSPKISVVRDPLTMPFKCPAAIKCPDAIKCPAAIKCPDAIKCPSSSVETEKASVEIKQLKAGINMKNMMLYVLFFICILLMGTSIYLKNQIPQTSQTSSFYGGVEDDTQSELNF